MCWFIGYTAQHDYGLFETRAANDELLPGERDETLLDVEREQLDFACASDPVCASSSRRRSPRPGYRSVVVLASYCVSK